MTKRSAKKAKTVITEKEQILLSATTQQYNAVRQALGSAEDKLRTVLDLIGDRYDVDLVGGEALVNQEGEIVLKAELEAERDKQLLTE